MQQYWCIVNTRVDLFTNIYCWKENCESITHIVPVFSIFLSIVLKECFILKWYYYLRKCLRDGLIRHAHTSCLWMKCACNSFLTHQGSNKRVLTEGSLQHTHAHLHTNLWQRQNSRLLVLQLAVFHTPGVSTRLRWKQSNPQLTMTTVTQSKHTFENYTKHLPRGHHIAASGDHIAGCRNRKPTLYHVTVATVTQPMRTNCIMPSAVTKPALLYYRGEGLMSIHNPPVILERVN